MKSQLAAAAALLAIAAAPAYAQNSAPITGSQVPLANGGMQPNINAPGANGSDAGNAWATSPMSSSGSSSTGAMSRGSSTAGANSAESATSAPTDMSNATTLSGGSSTTATTNRYPVCRTRSQDSCRVANSRR